jgi:hypothetical protein
MNGEVCVIDVLPHQSTSTSLTRDKTIGHQHAAISAIAILNIEKDDCVPEHVALGAIGSFEMLVADWSGVVPCLIIQLFPYLGAASPRPRDNPPRASKQSTINRTTFSAHKAASVRPTSQLVHK